MITHSDLVITAARWLKKDHALVVTEMKGYTEEPDAIGWTAYGDTTLVECKASRSDFKADAKKCFRQNPQIGLGDFRYYLCPEGLIQVGELPKGWGLLWLIGKRVYRKQEAERQPEKCIRGEIGNIISLVRRIGQNPPEGMSVKFYTYETQNRTTAGIEIPRKGD